VRGARVSTRLPRDLTGEAALRLRPEFDGDAFTIDATSVRTFDALAVATLESLRLRFESEEGRLAIIEPADPDTRMGLRRALNGGASDHDDAIVLGARAVANDLDVKAVAAALGGRLRDRVPEVIANTAVLAAAALADNAATHARERFPVVAASLTERELSICVRDCGTDATPDEAHLELIERIQLPLASDAAEWGASAGIAWVAHMIDRHSLDAELLFAAGTGRLHVPGKTAFCERQPPVEGFVALAKFALC
jgi:anti-sigma regulatory factor (Ser/Thr protein kinase)